MTRFEFGQRYRDAAGDTHIVTETWRDGRSALLLDDFDLIANPLHFDLEPVADEHLDGLVRIEDHPVMTDIVRVRLADEAHRASAYRKVPSDKVRTVYNAAHDARCSDRDIRLGRDTNGTLDGIRDRALRKIVDIVGDVNDAATITGFQREEVERAVRATA